MVPALYSEDWLSPVLFPFKPSCSRTLNAFSSVMLVSFGTDTCPFSSTVSSISSCSICWVSSFFAVPPIFTRPAARAIKKIRIQIMIAPMINPPIVIAFSSLELTSPSSSSSSSSSYSSSYSSSSSSSSSSYVSFWGVAYPERPSLMASSSSLESITVCACCASGVTTTKFPFGSSSECFRSSITSDMFSYLRSTLFCVHFRMICSRLYGRSGTYFLGDTISSCRCLIAIATVVSPSNGTCPVTISYMVIPSE